MTAGADATAAGTVEVRAGRFELLRVLGACTVVAPPAGAALTEALGIRCWDPAEHTRLFVLDLPPHESIHLGAEGYLGGDAAERAAGLWRALGLQPPADADHLASLLALYAHLGEAAAACRTDAARRRLDHAGAVLLHEHLWSWVPGYLTASRRCGGGEWCDLLGAALTREVQLIAMPSALPVAFREAPPPITPEIGLDELLDSVVAPLRVGFVITWADLAEAAGRLGVGLRRGERRFALRAMLEQDAPGTLGWLARHARWWASTHLSQGLGPNDPAEWWRARAEATASALDRLETAAVVRA